MWGALVHHAEGFNNKFYQEWALCVDYINVIDGQQIMFSSLENHRRKKGCEYFNRLSHK